ncbi:MAG: type II toxin-antitoxin system VapC family toxin [Alphaproteobacteria bacterium]|nr:type II toxin-antitoxin system VapC family toxin [Alphaproteobacteria bacterium]MBL6937418.1 type II toxin-antitoxin system VapC family toxin [Alphaproteobacteria bacterium]MBL7096020.1 type II toxin-antitoxin system VapC family toxin [Alphaproteobacteria bacterium]
MLAIDTNVLVRYLVGDHLEQSARAKRLIEREDAFVATTVLLEAEWVLRSVYGYEAHALANALTAFAGLQNVTLEDPAAAARALQWMKAGLDFADALHLAKAQGCTAFVTFDRNFARRAASLESVTVRAI